MMSDEPSEQHGGSINPARVQRLIQGGIDWLPSFVEFTSDPQAAGIFREELVPGVMRLHAIIYLAPPDNEKDKDE